MSSGQDRLANSAWRWRNSVWIIVPPLSIGLLTWAAFLYAGIRARRRAWQMMAGGYFVALVVGLVAVPVPAQEEFGIRDATTMFFLIIVCWLGGTVHAILIRPEYLRIVAVARPWHQDAAPADGAKSPVAPRPAAVSGDAAQTLGLDKEHAQFFAPGSASPSRSVAPPQAQPPPPQGSPPRQVPPARVQGQVPTSAESKPPPGHPVNRGAAASQSVASESDRLSLNSVGEEALAALPGLDPILAKRILVERQRRGGFHDVEDLAECGVPPHVVVRLRSVLHIDRSASQNPPRERRGRTLDL